MNPAFSPKNTFIRYVWLAAAAWTVIIIGLLTWNSVRLHEEVLEQGRVEARTAYQKDIFYRRWNSSMGGVYVPPSTAAAPNPYLSNNPRRDLVATDGTKLTLMNPAYMTRLVHELQKQEEGIQGHITSLNPIRPENAPDEWEIAALEAFARGEKEVSGISMFNGQEHLRLMRPLMTEESCLACHAVQGYKVGDLRGGISVSVPYAMLQAAENRQMGGIILGYGIIWVLGLAGGFWMVKQLNRQIQARLDLEKTVAVSQRLADLGTLTAGVAHELNSPLQVIVGTAERMLEDFKQEAVDLEQNRQRLERLQRSAWRAVDIIRALRTYLAGPQEQQNFQPHDLNGLVKDTILLTRAQLSIETRIQVDTILDENLPPLLCNQNQIMQVQLRKC